MDNITEAENSVSMAVTKGKVLAWMTNDSDFVINDVTNKKSTIETTL